VNLSDIDPIYLDTPYFLAPDGPVAEETYAVLLEAMRRSKKVAIARIVLSGRERLVAIQPKPEGFVLTTLRVNKEVRDASEAFEKLNVKLSDDMLAMAKQIIEQKSAKFDPRGFEDRYEQALLTLVRSKIAGGEPVITKAPERGNVINLMDALKRSIEEERRPPAPSLGKADAAASKSAATPAKKAAKAAKPAAARRKAESA
jgi:DNA end-binding protein Ku